MNHSFQRAMAALVLALLATTATAKADIVFTVNGTGGTADRIVRINADGTNPQVLWQANGSLSPRGIAVDPIGGRVIWSDSVSRQYSAVPLVGGAANDLFTGSNGSPNAIAVANNQLYAMEFGTSTATRGITQYNFDGTGGTNFFGNPNGNGINANSFVSVDSGLLYFSNNTDIYSRPLDGSAVASPVVTGTGNGVRGLAINGDTLYWLDNTSDTLNSRSISNNTGTISSVSLGTSATPHGLTTNGQFLFYADGQTDQRGIYRVNLDLTGATRIFELTNTETPGGVATVTAVPEPASLAVLATGFLAAGVSRFRKRRAAACNAC